MGFLCDGDQTIYHPEEGSCGKLCILLYSGQNAEDQTHQDQEEAV